MSHAPLTTEQYQNNKWQGDFIPNLGGLGVAQLNQLVRVQLPATYTRQWAIHMAPATTLGGGNVDNGGPQIDGNPEICLRWGQSAFNEEVFFDYPLQGGTVILNASYFEVWGRDSTSEPINAGRYRVWVQEAIMGTQQMGESRALHPVLTRAVSNLPQATSHTFVRPRRAVAYRLYVNGNLAITGNFGSLVVEQVGALGTIFDRQEYGTAANASLAVPKPFFNTLHPRATRIQVFNNGAGIYPLVTVAWILDLG